jgi:Na+/H+ antiporter NhaC
MASLMHTNLTTSSDAQDVSLDPIDNTYLRENDEQTTAYLCLLVLPIFTILIFRMKKREILQISSRVINVSQTDAQ